MQPTCCPAHAIKLYALAIPARALLVPRKLQWGYVEKLNLVYIPVYILQIVNIPINTIKFTCVCSRVVFGNIIQLKEIGIRKLSA